MYTKKGITNKFFDQPKPCLLPLPPVPLDLENHKNIPISGGRLAKPWRQLGEISARFEQSFDNNGTPPPPASGKYLSSVPRACLCSHGRRVPGIRERAVIDESRNMKSPWIFRRSSSSPPPPFLPSSLFFFLLAAFSRGATGQRVNWTKGQPALLPADGESPVSRFEM